MTLDEAIQRENKIAEENQKIVDTEIVFDDVSLSQLYCDDTEVIEEHLSNYRKCAEYHKQIAKWLEQLKSYKQNTDVCPMCDTYCSYLADEFENGYNKAIDETICKVEEHKTKGYVTGITNNPFEFGACQMADEIVKILEQLKAGVTND